MSGLAEELLMEAKEKMDATTTHDPQHTERAYRIATRMTLREGADLELVQVAAALHDIGRSYGEPHARSAPGRQPRYSALGATRRRGSRKSGR